MTNQEGFKLFPICKCDPKSLSGIHLFIFATIPTLLIIDLVLECQSYMHPPLCSLETITTAQEANVSHLSSLIVTPLTFLRSD